MLNFLLVLGAGYCLVLLLLFLVQDRLVFPGAGRGGSVVDVAGVRTYELQRAGGARFRVAEAGPAKPHAVVAFFVGNGEDLGSAAANALELAAHGVLAIAPEYPGYGASAGPPSVAALLAAADATAAHAAARAKELGVPFVVGGSSLGTFAAVHVAAAGLADRCLLRAPPTSIAAIAQAHYWWVPIGLLLRHRFDNTAAAARVRCPVLIVHGAADAIVPPGHGTELQRRFPSAELVLVDGCGHNDLALAPGGPCGARIGAFLRGT